MNIFYFHKPVTQNFKITISFFKEFKLKNLQIIINNYNFLLHLPKFKKIKTILKINLITMKKVFLIALGFFAFQTASAQESISYKPVKGTVTTEVGLNGGLNNAEVDLNDGVVKFRYFLKDDIALRAGLGLGSYKDVDYFNGGSETDKNSETNIKLGIEKHFAGTNRLSTYAGAELIFGFGKETSDESYDNGDYQNYEQKSSGFGLGLFTGADYYIAKKLYLGVEAGLSFMSEKTKDGETSSRFGNNYTTATTPGSKNSALETAAFGGIRVGFQF